jgi:hypothetical protein
VEIEGKEEEGESIKPLESTVLCSLKKLLNKKDVCKKKIKQWFLSLESHGTRVEKHC